MFDNEEILTNLIVDCMLTQEMSLKPSTGGSQKYLSILYIYLSYVLYKTF